MTANQLAFQNLKEQQRANLVKEQETMRANLAKEEETNRSNVAREEETHRTNVANERLKGFQTIGQTMQTFHAINPFSLDKQIDRAGKVLQFIK